MVFEKEVEEFFLMAPLDFVVVLHDVGFVGRALRRSALGEDCGNACGDKQSENKRFHGASDGVAGL
jgi:hypothetical protein